MSRLSRRSFLKTGATSLATLPILSGWPSILSRNEELIFRPFPHPVMPPINFAYATDAMGDPFKAPITITGAGVVVPESVASKPFALHTRWYVEGFGYVYLNADNGGRLYTSEDFEGPGTVNLNVAFAQTRVEQNREVMARYRNEGTVFSTETKYLHDLSQELLAEALQRNGEDAAQLADRSLLWALWAGEKTELEHAHQTQQRNPRTDEFHIGCETRQYIWAKSEDMTQRFEALFNYATVTHYIYDTWYEIFEPREGVYRWGLKDNIVDWLTENGITIEGRPLFWFHSWVTPDWLKEKNFEQLKDYVVRHVQNVVGHYGDKISHWEVVNEYHDWANVHNFNPDQITDITRLACETTHDVNPDVVRIINNCCPFAEYAAHGRQENGEANRPLRSPRQFVQDIIEADVPFEVIGLQVYYPHRSLSDIARLVERFSGFGKPVLITEIGTTSGPTKQEILTGDMSMPEGPYDWHRQWDEDLQADWLEQTYRIFYSKPFIQGISWYDFADFRTFIQNGGLIRVDGKTKASYHRLQNLLKEWDRLPEKERSAVMPGNN